MAVRNDFTAGEVLAAADLNDTFASKVDYATPTNAQTGTAYTFVAADAEKLTTASNGSAVTLTIPPASSVAWPDETILRVVNYGAGAVTIDGGSGVTVTNTSSTIAQYGAAVAIRTGSDAWTVVPFGGGDVPSATVSSPAATGQYTDGSGDTWDYFTFTSSGTLTVATAGFADVLVVGGGGGGGSGTNSGWWGGGGGAGGYFYLTDVYLDATSYTVTVGAGGAAGNTAGAAATSGNASGIGPGLVAIGGGEGATNSNPGGRGGSGGGGGQNSGTNSAGGTSQYPQQGNSGGASIAATTGGGGGGAAEAGNTDGSGHGGDGLANSITGSSVTRAGGGAGHGGTAGDGGGGAAGAAGTANTGGGGGANVFAGAPGAGGSGVVIVRVKA